MKCALSVKISPPATLDCAAKGDCDRANIPNLPHTSPDCWDSSDQCRQDVAIASLKEALAEQSECTLSDPGAAVSALSSILWLLTEAIVYLANCKSDAMLRCSGSGRFGTSDLNGKAFHRQRFRSSYLRSKPSRGV